MVGMGKESEHSTYEGVELEWEAGVMSADECEEKMMEIAGWGDVEGSHMEGDKLMMGLLEELGYGAGVAVYEKMRKWYA